MNTSDKYKILPEDTQKIRDFVNSRSESNIFIDDQEIKTLDTDFLEMLKGRISNSSIDKYMELTAYKRIVAELGRRNTQ